MNIDEILNKIVLTRLKAKKEELEARLANAKSEAEKLKISLAIQLLDEVIKEYEG